MATNPLFEPGDNEAPEIPTEGAEDTTPEAPPEAAPEATLKAPPEAAPEAAPAAESDDMSTKYDNIRAALRDERQEKQQIMAELGALRERTATLEKLKQEMDEYRKGRQLEQEQSAFDSDPAMYLKEQLQSTNDRIDSLVNQSEQNNQEQLRQAQHLEYIRAQAAAYRQKNPDYDNALAYLHQDRMRDYEYMGIPAEHREQMFAQESVAFADTAISQNRDIGEYVYEYARNRGYQPQAPQTPQQVNEQQTQKGSSPSNASPAEAQAMLNRLQAGQDAASSLSNTGQGDDDSLLKQIEDMSDAEFDKFWESNIVPRNF